MIVFHYTTKAGHDGIKSGRVIYQSTDTVRDALLGPGVYCTTLSPYNCTKAQIARNNYGNPAKAQQGFIDYYIQLDIPDYELQENGDGRNIYCYPGRDLWIDNYNPKFGKV